MDMHDAALLMPPLPPLPPMPVARRPIRLAFVTETYPPEVNGVATTTAQFVDGLRRRGHEVQLVRPRQERDDEATAGPQRQHLQQVLMRGLPIPKYPHLRMGMPGRRTLLGLWQQRRPDLVHVATEGPLGFSALQAAQQLGLPVTADFRTNFHAYSRHYGIGWLKRPIMAYLRSFHNRCAGTMVPTEPLRRELMQAGFERLHVVPRGVDTARFSPRHRSAELRACWGAQPGDVVVGCVGRLAPEKNLSLLLEAWRAVRQQHANARLVLVGDGPLRGELAAAAPEAVFAGLRQGDELAAHYASMDLFAFPSLTETFGNVTVEALASGLPVLAFDHAAAGQLIASGDNGCLVAPGDGAGFVAAALALAADAALRQRLAAAGLHTAGSLGWEAVIEGFERHLALACGVAAAAEGMPAQAALA